MFPKRITRTRRAALATGLATASFALLTGAASAVEVSKVQLGFTDKGGNLCPRIITMKAWAHTEGPGVVEFMVRNSSGNKTGAMSASAVKGPTGNWLATLTHKFKITTDVDTQYMAEVKGSPKISAWVPLKEACLGDAPKTVKGTGITGKHISEKDQDKDKDNAPKPTVDGKPLPPQGGEKPLPTGGGKPLPGGKPLAQCLDKKVTAQRLAAVTRAGGTTTAWIAWEHAVKKVHGDKYADSFSAKSRKADCKWSGLFNCTVSAIPCRS